ncbi:hypothetical protein F511_23002 [Dorcoceras hygrometricum]|uniref:Uncharacterized protein n=1 Tax=Dorcoceras hygrometricum TaxID=472368 RepID=A0A2Z7AQ38_9LAMI|nr:hypothetical protein F511_23002 [Dorcoceras hygrometricum]
MLPRRGRGEPLGRQLRSLEPPSAMRMLLSRVYICIVKPDRSGRQLRFVTVNSQLRFGTANSQLRYGTANSQIRYETVNSDLRQSTANSNLDGQQSTQIWKSQQPTQIWTVKQSIQIWTVKQSTQIWDSQPSSGLVHSSLDSQLSSGLDNSALDGQTQLWPSQLRFDEIQIWRRKFRFGDVNSDLDSDFSSVACYVIPMVRNNILWNNLTTFYFWKYLRLLGNGPLYPPYSCFCCPSHEADCPGQPDHMIRRLRAKPATERRESAAMKKEHESTQVALEASHTTIVGLIEIGLCMSNKIERMKAKKQQSRESHQECHHNWQARIQVAEDTIQEQHLIIEALVEEKASLLQTIQGLQEDNRASAPFDDEWEEEPKEDPEEEGLEGIPLGEGEIVEE